MLDKLRALLGRPDTELRAQLEQLTSQAESAALASARDAWLKTMLADRLLTPYAAARAAELWTPETEPALTALLQSIGPPPTTNPPKETSADPIAQLAEELKLPYDQAAMRYLNREP